MDCQYKVHCHLSIRTGNSSPNLPRAASVDRKPAEKFHLKSKSLLLIDIRYIINKDYFSPPIPERGDRLLKFGLQRDCKKVFNKQ